jgi:hypothetical protein
MSAPRSMYRKSGLQKNTVREESSSSSDEEFEFRDENDQYVARRKPAHKDQIQTRVLQSNLPVSSSLGAARS